jgi:hypothetical protein
MGWRFMPPNDCSSAARERGAFFAFRKKCVAFACQLQRRVRRHMAPGQNRHAASINAPAKCCRRSIIRRRDSWWLRDGTLHGAWPPRMHRRSAFAWPLCWKAIRRISAELARSKLLRKGADGNAWRLGVHWIKPNVHHPAGRCSTWQDAMCRLTTEFSCSRKWRSFCALRELGFSAGAKDVYIWLGRTLTNRDLVRGAYRDAA